MRFHVHPDGWPLRVDFPTHALVLPDHPWATREGAHVVDTLDELLHRTVHALVGTVRPIIDACRRTARIGTVGLWNEVADSLGKAVAFQHPELPRDCTTCSFRAVEDSDARQVFWAERRASKLCDKDTEE